MQLEDCLKSMGYLPKYNDTILKTMALFISTWTFFQDEKLCIWDIEMLESANIFLPVLAARSSFIKEHYEKIETYQSLPSIATIGSSKDFKLKPTVGVESPVPTGCGMYNYSLITVLF